MHKNLKRPTERGAILSIALLIGLILLASGALAIWGLRGETSGAGQDRRSRNLLSCAERALALGKQFFGGAGWSGRDAYLAGTSCASLPCGPFSANAPGPAVIGYPAGAPFSGTITEGGMTLSYQMAIYNNQESPLSPFADADNQVMVWARCSDPDSGQARSVQTLLSVPPQPPNGDYTAQAGRGLRNQGNSNY